MSNGRGIVGSARPSLCSLTYRGPFHTAPSVVSHSGPIRLTPAGREQADAIGWCPAKAVVTASWRLRSCSDPNAKSPGQEGGRGGYVAYR